MSEQPPNVPPEKPARKKRPYGGRKHGSSVSVVRKRLRQVEKFLLMGESEAAIQSGLAEEWQLTTRAVRRYIAAVRARWEKLDGEMTPVRDRAELRQKLNDTYKGARLARDFHAMNQVMRTFGRHFLPHGLDITSGGKPIGAVVLTTEDALRELEAGSRALEREQKKLVGDAPSAPGLPAAPIPFPTKK